MPPAPNKVSHFPGVVRIAFLSGVRLLRESRPNVAIPPYGPTADRLNLGVIGVQVPPPSVVDSNWPFHFIQPTEGVAKSKRTGCKLFVVGQKGPLLSLLKSPFAPVDTVVSEGGIEEVLRE